MGLEDGRPGCVYAHLQHEQGLPQADVNGTYDGKPETEIPYDDYVEYKEGETAEGDEIYDADTNDVDEGDGALEGTNITTVADQTHTAAKTGTATVITMQEWIDGGMQIGDFWVWDTDGWAYWAQGIDAGETTGLLLDEIIHSNPPSDSWYYGINVVGQFVTADDIGFLNNTGFYDTEAGSFHRSRGSASGNHHRHRHSQHHGDRHLPQTCHDGDRGQHPPVRLCRCG